MKLKDVIFSYLEFLLDTIKFNGVFFVFPFIYHSIKIKFLKNPSKKSRYKIFGFTLVFMNRESLVNLLLELFGTNFYYFKSNTDKPIILDMGANIGDSMLYFKWLYPKAIVYSYEPNPKAYELLEENVKINNLTDVHTYPYGLGKEDTEIDFYDDYSGVHNLSTIDKNFISSVLKDAPNTDKRIQPIKVKLKNISEISEIHQLAHIDLVKLDIEGGEGEVIEGLKPFLHKIQNVILEYHLVSEAKSNSFDSILETLRSNGFNVNIAGLYRNHLNRTSLHAFMIMGYK